MRGDPFAFITYIREHQEQFNRLLVQHLQLTVTAVLLAIVMGISVMVWAGGQLAALIRHGHPLDASVGDALQAAVRLPDHMGDPRLAWPEPARHQLPGPVLYWAASILALAAAGAVGWAGWRLFRGPGEALDRRTRVGVPAQGRLANRRELRPLLTRRPEPRPVRAWTRWAATRCHRVTAHGAETPANSRQGSGGPHRCQPVRQDDSGDRRDSRMAGPSGALLAQVRPPRRHRPMAGRVWRCTGL